jgi:uncharacterized protein YegP (UPF0339 family)
VSHPGRKSPSDTAALLTHEVPLVAIPVRAGASGEVSKQEEPMRFMDGYRARLWSGSNLVWWTEGYARKADAQNAIRIAKAAHNAPVYDRTQRVA